VCHVPPGNPDNPRQLCIAPSAVADHLDNHEGDTIGPCNLECTGTNPAVACVDLTVDVQTDLFGGETSWELIDLDAGLLIDSRPPGSLQGEYSDSYCGDPSHCYESRFHDSFGDGMCCAFGQGYYSITLDGNITSSPSGGAFGSDETVRVGDCTLQALAAQPETTTESLVAAQSAAATGFVIRDQRGTVSAIGVGKTETKNLRQDASDSISVEPVKPGPGIDYGKATATTAFQANLIHVTLTADVNEFGYDGAAKGRVAVQFSVEQNTNYAVELATTDVTGGLGAFGERASIVLSNDKGVILRKAAGDDAIRCNPDGIFDPKFDALCQTLTPGAYTLELRASAYAPAICDECSSRAVRARSEVKIVTVP